MSKRILIVDDREENRKRIERKLSIIENDYETTFSTDGLDAIKKLNEFEKNPFGLILTDIQMDKLDGFGLLSEIKKSDKWYSDLPVIAVSDNPDYETRWYREGGINFMKRPLSTQVLLAILDRFYNQKLINRI